MERTLVHYRAVVVGIDDVYLGNIGDRDFSRKCVPEITTPVKLQIALAQLCIEKALKDRLK